MGKKNKDVGGEKKVKKNTAAIDERFKKALAIQPPEDNPFKMENEAKIDRWRPLYSTDWRTIKTQARQERRDSRPKKPKNRYF